MDNILVQDSQGIIDNVDLSWFGNKKVLITGASGLIGIHFLSAIKEYCKKYNKKIEVTAMVSNNPVDFFLDVCNYEGFKYIVHDLVNYDYDNLDMYDAIFHCATYGQPIYFLQNQLQTINLNTSVTQNLLSKLKFGGKFLFISSSEVYNGLSKDKFSETDIGITNTTDPRACYIEGKKLGETICNIYKQNGYDIKCARLCLAYGTGVKLNDVRVINTFIKKGINGSIDLLDKGQAIRTYCYIVDAIEMMFKVLIMGNDFIYNIGGVSEITIGDLAYKIAEKLNSNITFPKNDDKLKGSPVNVKLDITKYIEEFGVKQFIDIDEGLDRTINWYKYLLKILK